jgi:hypothetical protein
MVINKIKAINKNFWPDNSIYFLTGSTFLHFPYFKQNKQKQILLNQIKKVRKKLKIPISAYSILVNHYHIKLYIIKGRELAKVKQILHGGTSFEYRNKFNMKYNEMWQSSRAYVITSEDMNCKVTGYINGNLLKHKEVNTLEELKGNKYSSYKYYFDIYGKEYINNLIYQVINIDEKSNGSIDFKKLCNVEINRPSAKAG